MFLSHPIAARLGQHAKVLVRPMDDLLAGPESYGMTLTLALQRGFDDLKEAVTETNLLFLNSDFILADGSYISLAKKLQQGVRLVAAPSYCANAEAVLPLLENLKSPSTHALALDKRRMAKIILENLHNTIIGQTIDSAFHFDHVYIYQLYMRITADTLIGYQMPVALVAMRPTIAHHRIRTFWDWGVASEFCPGVDYEVLGDSDEFLMMELRARDVGQGYIRTGSLSPTHIATQLSPHLTYDQFRCADNILILHSRDLYVNLVTHRKGLDAIRNQIRYQLHNPQLVGHIHHSNWTYHLQLLNQHLKKSHIGESLSRFTRKVIHRAANRMRFSK